MKVAGSSHVTRKELECWEVSFAHTVENLRSEKTVHVFLSLLATIALSLSGIGPFLLAREYALQKQEEAKRASEKSIKKIFRKKIQRLTNKLDQEKSKVEQEKKRRLGAESVCEAYALRLKSQDFRQKYGKIPLQICKLVLKKCQF